MKDGSGRAVLSRLSYVNGAAYRIAASRACGVRGPWLYEGVEENRRVAPAASRAGSGTEVSN